MLHVEGQGDYFDGIWRPQTVIAADYTLYGEHSGTVRVRAGHFTLRGEINGTLTISDDLICHIFGKQNGTLDVGSGATIIVVGEINGAVSVSARATVVIERTGHLAGTLVNSGEVIVRGAFGGQYSGHCQFKLEGDGRIKQPVVKDGIVSYYWD